MRVIRYNQKMQLRVVDAKLVQGKTVLYRSPYDIDVVVNNGVASLVSDERIKATLPTLRFLIELKCRVVILTYVGRPNGKIDETLRTKPHAKRLGELLGREVPQLEECVGSKVTEHIQQMAPGDLVMLENTRFHVGEVEDDDLFAQQLAENGEVVVFDAFPQSHRSHASVTGILRHLPSYAGFYLQSEVQALSGLLERPVLPLTIVIGGAKISDKTLAIANLWNRADLFLVGGGVANLFLKSSGKEIGSSYIEEQVVNDASKVDWVEFVQKYRQAQLSGDRVEMWTGVLDPESVQKVQVPTDVIVANKLGEFDTTRVVTLSQWPGVCVGEEAIVDIGPVTQERFAGLISSSGTVFWNGPMGMAENSLATAGSYAIAKAMAESKAETIIAGGDTIAVASKVASLDDFTHVSLAGGATLEFLAGKELPALSLLRL